MTNKRLTTLFKVNLKGLLNFGGRSSYGDLEAAVMFILEETEEIVND